MLDQFSRSVFRGTPAAYAQDARALALCQAGLANGDYAALATAFEKLFFAMPLIHAEGPDLLARADQSIALGDVLRDEAPSHLAQLFEFSAQQPREHRKVIEQFGRHPHRNAILGRRSSPEELAFLADGCLPHLRKLDF